MKLDPFMMEADARDLDDSFNRVVTLVSRMKYKPNWQFDVLKMRETGTVMVVAKMMVPDSTGQAVEAGTFIHPAFREPGMPVPDPNLLVNQSISFSWQALWGMRDEDVVGLIFNSLIVSMERHEAQEWFRLDGELIYDPHKEKSP